MEEYKNIIFDLGGVIINLDMQRTFNAFAQYSAVNFSDLFSMKGQVAFFSDYETGKIPCETFRAQLNQSLGCALSDEELDAAWNAMLLDIPPARIELLKKIGQQKRIFLLSNTNAIHKKAFDLIVKNTLALDSLDSLFEKAYYSHLMGDRKPNTSSFRTILDENGLQASETLFIDDTPQHIEGARRAGLHAYHLVKDMTIEKLFGKQN